MKTNNLPTNRKNQERGKQEMKSSRTLRIFSIVMLLLLALTSFGRITSANRRSSPSGLTPTGQGLLARVLVFHREDRGSSWCEDLLISAVGDAVYSRCGNGVEKQYALNETERQQLQSWIQEFRAVNYDHNDMSQVDGSKTQLFLNGQGTQRATDAETQQMIDFITALDKKIASQS